MNTKLVSTIEKFDTYLLNIIPDFINSIGNVPAFSKEEINNLLTKTEGGIPDDLLFIYTYNSPSAFLIASGFLPIWYHKFSFNLILPKGIGELRNYKETLECFIEDIESEYDGSTLTKNATEILLNIKELKNLKTAVLKDASGNYAIVNKQKLYFYLHDDADFMLAPTTFSEMVIETVEKIISGVLILDNRLDFLSERDGILDPNSNKFREEVTGIFSCLAAYALENKSPIDAIKWAEKGLIFANKECDDVLRLRLFNIARKGYELKAASGL